MDWLLNLASKCISPTATVQVLYYWVFFNYHNYFKRLMKIKPFHANACVALFYVNDYCHHYYFSRYYYYHYHNHHHHYYFHLCYDTIFLKIHILPTYYFAKRKIFFNFDIVMQNKLYHVYLSIVIVIIIFVFIIFIFIFIIIIIIVTIFVLL